MSKSTYIAPAPAFLRSPSGTLVSMPEERPSHEVTLGDLVIKPETGPRSNVAFVLTASGQKLVGQGAVWAVYLRLLEQQQATSKPSPLHSPKRPQSATLPGHEPTDRA